MIPLFAGLTASNLILLTIVFVLGLSADATDPASKVYPIHMAMGIAAGLMVLLSHMSVFIYFMGTVKWLEAASLRADIEPSRFMHPASRHKRRAFALVMTAITITMLTMFAGAGADPTVSKLWPAEVHLMMACLTIAVNAGCALGEYRLIRAQSDVMDNALTLVNDPETNEMRSQ
jgi:hypothetical protein